MSKSKIIGYGIIVVWFSFSLQACWNNDPHEMNSKQDSQLTDEQQIKQRAEKRWEAVIARDFETAFKYTTPSFQSTYSPLAVKRYYGGGMRRDQITVERIDIDPSGTTANVLLRMYYVSDVDERVLDTNVRERWIKVDGSWWLVQKK